MRIATRATLSALIVALVGAAALWPAAAVHAVAAPTGVFVVFGDSSATVYWTEVPGSHGYGVTIRPLGVSGPYGQELVLGDRWTVPYTAFPGYGENKDGYTYEVCAISKSSRRACNSINDLFYVESQGSGVSTSNLRKAAHKISDCLGKGEKAAVVEAARGGTVAALASWIPGIGEVTAAEVAAVSAGEGTGTFATCLVDW